MKHISALRRWFSEMPNNKHAVRRRALDRVLDDPTADSTSRGDAPIAQLLAAAAAPPTAAETSGLASALAVFASSNDLAHGVIGAPASRRSAKNQGRPHRRRGPLLSGLAAATLATKLAAAGAAVAAVGGLVATAAVVEHRVNAHPSRDKSRPSVSATPTPRPSTHVTPTSGASGATAGPPGNPTGAASSSGRGTTTKTPPGQAKKTKTPPGQTKTPPGQAKKTKTKTPPGQMKTPPGQAKKTSTPPGHSKKPGKP